jgi:hypothetical protein
MELESFIEDLQLHLDTSLASLTDAFDILSYATIET